MSTGYPPPAWDDEHPLPVQPTPAPVPDDAGVDWIEVPPVNSAVSGDGAYADCITHCERWRYYSTNDKTTSAHECTHGINADLRNRNGAGYGTSLRFLCVRVTQDGTLVESPVEHDPVFPEGYAAASAGGKRINAFYCLKNRGVILPEPPIRKRDAIPFIPSSLREYRFKTYISGQTAWDDTPLYVFDEWVAYANGCQAALDLIAAGERMEWTDQALGPLEFQIYSLAVLMATEKKDAAALEPLLPFFRWNWKRTWETYFAAKVKFPWDKQDRIEAELLRGSDGQAMRDFGKRHGIEFPS